MCVCSNSRVTKHACQLFALFIHFLAASVYAVLNSILDIPIYILEQFFMFTLCIKRFATELPIKYYRSFVKLKGEELIFFCQIAAASE